MARRWIMCQSVPMSSFPGHDHWGGTPSLDYGRAVAKPTIGARQRQLRLSSCSPLPAPCAAKTPHPASRPHNTLPCLHAKDRVTLHIHSNHSINTRKHPTPTRLGKGALVVPTNKQTNTANTNKQTNHSRSTFPQWCLVGTVTGNRNREHIGHGSVWSPRKADGS